MHIIDVLIISIIILKLSSLLICTVYTRVAVILEKRVYTKQEKQESTVKNTASNSKRKNLRRMASFLYYKINPYLYGLMRYECLMVGHVPSGRIRRTLYRFIFNMRITKETVLYGGSEFRSPWNINMSNVVVSNNCLLDGRNGITIGKSVVFGAGVRVWTEEHSVNDAHFRVLPENKRGVIIDDRAWICSDTTILPGVHIGEGAVIASRACVTKDCEPFGVYAGVPARKIGERNHNLEYVLDGTTTWHFY